MAHKKKEPARKDRRHRRRGPRQRYWVCFGIRNRTTISDVIAWPPETPDEKPNKPVVSDKISTEKCRAVFKRKHGVEPREIVGPIYKVLDRPVRFASGLKLSPGKLTKITGNSFSGQYKGWRLACIGLKKTTGPDGVEYGNDELVIPILDRPIGDSGRTRPVFPPGYVLKSREISGMKRIKK